MDIKRILGRIYEIIEDEGFEVNNEKTKIMLPHQRQVLHDCQ